MGAKDDFKLVVGGEVENSEFVRARLMLTGEMTEGLYVVLKISNKFVSIHFD